MSHELLQRQRPHPILVTVRRIGVSVMPSSA
jgi:hypothetical protein